MNKDHVSIIISFLGVIILTAMVCATIIGKADLESKAITKDKAAVMQACLSRYGDRDSVFDWTDTGYSCRKVTVPAND